VASVTQPRVPCYKLAAKFGREDIIKRFSAGGRSSVYLKAMRKGEVRAGDAIELISGEAHAATVAEVAKLYRDGRDKVDFNSVRCRSRRCMKTGVSISSNRSNNSNVSQQCQSGATAIVFP
jgi:MOSC domain-containing protein YiiM